jgi:hypothetical protein
LFEYWVRAEINFVVQTDSYTWNRLAAVIGNESYSARHLLHDAVHAAHVSGAFIERRVLSVAKGYPWCLAAGCIEDNLRDLATTDPPDLDAGCGQKIKKLLTIGYPFALLVLGVALLLEVVWGARAVEQGHPFLFPCYLPLRSCIHQCRALFSLCHDEAVLARMMRKMDRLLRTNVRSDGRKVFLGALCDEVRQVVPAGLELNPSVRQAIMGGHGAAYKSLPSVVRAQYELQAEDVQEQKQKELADNIGML